MTNQVEENNQESATDEESIKDKVEGGVKETASAIRKKAPTFSKIIRKSDNPKEAHEHATDEMQDSAGDYFQNQFQNYLQEKTSANAEKVHKKAEEAKETMQEKLLKLKEQIASVKESGEELQEKISGDSNRRVKGVQDIKSVSEIKSSSDIKGPKEVKGLADIKTYHS
ncbi:gas vesicle protein GvpQ [Halobacillus mangrovi]|uniref:gas vesicle protein GvpQ n=1 Tax=Halobacillus mangrovi TaxID=402384 RepID=UPI003D9694C5